MSHGQEVDHVLAVWVADARITHADDVAYWRRRISYFLSHAAGYRAEHVPRVDWSDTPSQEPCKPL